jgi:aminoglycoside phosphotransferase (APT) family kinase protein
MTVEVEERLSAIQQAILPWLYDRLPCADRIGLAPLVRPEAGGSSDTLMLDAEIAEGGAKREERWVLRIEPVWRPIYRDASVERQFRVLEAVNRVGAVPVPRVLWYEGDRSILGAPFFLMERVEGTVCASRYHSAGLFLEMAPAEREKVWLSGVEVLARLHSLPVEPFAFLGRPELGATGIEQELAYWDSYAAWSEVEPWPEQDRARRWLDDHMPRAEQRRTGLAWGDARPGNMIFHDGRCAAIIDWETASLGSAESDLGWWMWFDWNISEGAGHPRLPELGPIGSIVGQWEAYSGRKAEAMEWHELFATWRYSFISRRARRLAGMPMPPASEDPVGRRLAMLAV